MRLCGTDVFMLEINFKIDRPGFREEKMKTKSPGSVAFVLVAVSCLFRSIAEVNSITDLGPSPGRAGVQANGTHHEPKPQFTPQGRAGLMAAGG